MHDLPRIQDLPDEEIAELFERQGQKVPTSVVTDLRLFIDEVGGIENAYAAVEMLSDLEAAA